MDNERKTKINELQEKLNLDFNNLQLLNQALSHSSYVNENLDIDKDNEKLEFLGDSVLSLIVTEFLYTNFKDKTEGELSRMKSFIVSEKSLSDIAKKISLGDYLLLGKGEKQSGGKHRKAILADTLEAVLGAYYLDKGFADTKKFILKYVSSLAEQIITNNYQRDYKTELQLLIQQKTKSCPAYITTKEEGPDHDKLFYVDVFVNEEMLGSGKGKNKKTAQQEAAKIALENILANKVSIE